MSTPLPTAATAQTSPRSSYRPALDGLRAIAVLAVIVYHVNESWLGGGWFGVDIFFVLSGFLITRLLLREHSRTGRIDFVRFWLARARRLGPALILVLVAVALAGCFLTEPVRRGPLAMDVGATLVYLANWHFLTSDEGYFATLATPSPLRHMWSLSVEEQFYLVFPILLLLLLLLVRRRRGPLTVALGLLAVSSAVWMHLHFTPGVDPSRVYYGTDTRAFELLVGATAAAVLSGGSHGLPVSTRRILDATARRAAIPAAVIVVLLLWTAGLGQDALFNGWLLPACVSVVVVVIAAASPHPSVIQKALSVEPLRRIGLISYGLYLWHWPVIVFTTLPLKAWPSPLAAAVQIALSFALAGLSYRLVEARVRHGGLRGLIPRRPRAGWAVAVATFGVLGALTLTLPLSAPSPAAAARGGNVVPPTLQWTPPQPPIKVTLVGNSIPASLAKAFPADSLPGFSVNDITNVGCDGIDAPKLNFGKVLRPTQECVQWRAQWGASLTKEQPDVAVLFASKALLSDHQVNGRDLAFDAPDYAAFVDAYLDQELAKARPGADRVLLANLACHDVTTFGGDQETERLNDPRSVERLNAMLSSWAQRAGVPIVDQYRFLCADGYTPNLGGVQLYADGYHFTSESGPKMWSWLAPEILRLTR